MKTTILGFALGMLALLGFQRMIYGQWAIPYVKYYEDRFYICEHYVYPDGNIDTWGRVYPTNSCLSI